METLKPGSVMIFTCDAFPDGEMVQITGDKHSPDTIVVKSCNNGVLYNAKSEELSPVEEISDNDRQTIETAYTAFITAAYKNADILRQIRNITNIDHGNWTNADYKAKFLAICDIVNTGIHLP